MEYGLVALWLVVYLALLLAGLPLAAVLFPRLADRGAGVAVPISAAVLWVVGYWVGHLSLSVALWAGLAVLVALVVGVGYRREFDFDNRVVAETVAVFTVAFLFLVAVRAFDPAVHSHGGEKFLDFGLLKSLLRTNALPPEDMWFAGEPVRYYYGGHLLASLLTRLTGTPAAYAYNLALAGFYAMLVTAAFGVTGSIAAHRGTSRTRAGLLGAFFVGFAANLETAGQLVVLALPDAVVTMFADLLSTEISGLGASLSAAQNPWWYFGASRIIEGTINEFPLFAWLNGDLHAHMMSTPFLLLVAALLFAYFRTPATELTRRRALVFGAVPPVASVLAVVNTWSFPSVGGLTILALAFAPADPTSLLPGGRSLRQRLPGELARLAAAGVAGVAVVALGVLWSAPFWFGTASGRAIGLLPDRSGLSGLLIVHGAFLVVFSLYLTRHAVPRIGDPRRVAVMMALVVLIAIGPLGAPAVALFAPLLVVAWLLLRWPALGPSDGRAGDDSVTTADGGTVEGAAPDSEPDPAPGNRSTATLPRPGFETVLLIAGTGLVLLVEFVFVRENAGPGRMNTVFKTYAQVWVLWGVAAGAALAHLVWDHRPQLALSGGVWKPAMRVLAAVLVVATASYGVLALATHFDSGGEVTLDGTRFVEQHHPREAAAIQWLDDEIEGQPNIVTAPGGYTWNADEGEGANAPSSLTGVPTVVGWFHEIGYRGQEPYVERKNDVRTIYTGSPSQQAALLQQYDVEYVYVGPAERNRYGRASFEGVPGVTVEKQWEHVTIYRVDQSALEG